MEKTEPKIGIFVCECGGNISDVVDVKTIIETVKNWSGVAEAKHQKYLCSKPSQEVIVNAIKKKKLDRIVVASCTPRMHLATFQSVLEQAGLNPYMLEFVNIREQTSWVHADAQAATRKAISLIRGGYERSLEFEPLEKITEKSSREILVVGGGIAGITAALQLGYLGFKVHVVERNSSIGGNMAKLTKVFPTLDCAQCILTPRMAEVGRNPNVNLLTYAEVEDISGRPGNYKITVSMKSRGVDTEKCKSCGVCAKVCPVTVPNDFNEGMSSRKAAYIDFPQAVPSIYVIDFDACTKCLKCQQLCPSKAVNLNEESRIVELKVGAIIMATGYQLYDPNKLKIYGYGVIEDVITMMELERLISASGPTGGNVKRADGNEVKKMAIILCAGSRDKNHISYCSRICCMYSLKQAYVLKKMLGINVNVYYIDIRATGKGYEELYWRDEEAGVVFTKGRVAEIWKKKDKLVVLAEDTLMGEVVEEEFDLVALATPMIPPSGLGKLSSKLKLSLGEEGFIQEKHPKLDPVNTLRTGVFACGCALSPKDVRDTVSDALAAASKASLFLKGERITTSPEKAFINEELCDASGFCVQVCPVDAITIEADKAQINPFICIGCGACIPVCPNEAIDFKNSTSKQIIANLRGVLLDKKPDEIQIIVFVDRNVGYTGIDFLGLDRINYPENIRIVTVPSTAIVSLKHLLYAFALGADGTLVIEGQQDIDEKYSKKRMMESTRALSEYGIKSMRVRYSYVPLPVYKKAADLFTKFTERIKKFGPLPEIKRRALKEKLGIP